MSIWSPPIPEGCFSPFGDCRCSCHFTPGVKHVMPCCYPEKITMNTANDLIRRDTAEKMLRANMAGGRNLTCMLEELAAIPASPPPAVESAQGEDSGQQCHVDEVQARMLCGPPAQSAKSLLETVTEVPRKFDPVAADAELRANGFAPCPTCGNATPPPSPASVDEAMVERAFKAMHPLGEPSSTERKYMRAALVAALSLPDPAQVGEKKG